VSLLEIDKLTVSYAGCAAAAVENLSLNIASGESVGIVGESGAGKSQTALAIMGLLPANANVGGSIKLSGEEVVRASKKTMREIRAQKVSMIFQDPATALNPYVKVGDQLRRILLEHGLVHKRHARTRCIEMLERVGLPEPQKQYKRYSQELSGGMRQRVLIAAALIGVPELIVADEPTTALDVTVQSQILTLLRDLRQEFDTALLMITHDLGVIAQSCHRLLVMDNGHLIEEGLCEDLLVRPQHPHTAKLIAAASRIDVDPPLRRSRSKEVKATLEVEKLRVIFRDRLHRSRDAFVAVTEFDISVDAGETIAIVGESGSGKTSAARAIAGLIRGNTGSISLHGKLLPRRVEDRPRALRRQLQMVFQEPVSSLSPAMRVGGIIAEPLTVHSPGLKAPARKLAVTEMLDRVGLEPELRERFPHELSGGQAQRVAIARALIVDPAVLICDEALAALDGTVRRDIIALLKVEQQRSQMSLIMITHDLGVVREICDRVYVMHNGEICETGRNDEIFSNPQHAYTKSLLAAVPVLPDV